MSWFGIIDGVLAGYWFAVLIDASSTFPDWVAASMCVMMAGAAVLMEVIDDAL